MSQGINFESKTEIDNLRKEKKKARERLLKKAEKEHEEKQKLKKKQLESILPDIHKRVEQDYEEYEKKHKYKKQKRQKHKKSSKSEKHKKSKKDKKHRSSDSDSENKWVEMTADKTGNSLEPSPSVPSTEKIERQSWMVSDDFGGIFGSSNKNSSMKDLRAKEHEEMLAVSRSRELNPYWKDGGTGLPTKEADSTKENKGFSGDGGLLWWTKALERCKQMAEVQGVSLESVAADRYGSLDELMKKIKEAEKFSKKTSRFPNETSRSRLFKKPNHSDGHNDYKKDRRYDRVDDRGRDKREGWRKKGSDVKGESNHERSGLCKVDRDLKRGHNEKEDEERRRDNVCDKKKDLKRSDVKSEAFSSSLSSSSSSRESSPSVNKNIGPVNNKKEVKKLTSEEKNKLAAKLLKAELMGDSALVNELKKQMEEANEEPEEDRRDKKEMLMVTNQRGEMRPYQGGREQKRSGKGRKKGRYIEAKTNDDDDDDDGDIQCLIKREKLISSHDDQLMFARLKGKLPGNNIEDETLDDEWIHKNSSKSYIDTRSRQIAIIEQKRLNCKIESCYYCFDNCPKHLVISIGKKVYLSLPQHKSMVEGHCIITPLHHVSQSTSCDEDVLEEIIVFKRQLVSMFKEEKKEVVFLETCKSLKNQPHFGIECIPLEKEMADMAPIYFSKAINDSGGEWASNKKLVRVRGTSLKQAIPAGFPFFYVSFNLDEGFVHVIDDEAAFPYYFGREVLGGMMDLAPDLWRRPHKEDFEGQQSKAAAFSQLWRPYDHTIK